MISIMEKEIELFCNVFQLNEEQRKRILDKAKQKHQKGE